MIHFYIKTHNKTGLKYFGKTVSEDVHLYRGSGVYWNRHCKKHGYDFSTEVVAVYDDTDTEKAKMFGKSFSEKHSIMESNEWANLKNELLDGGFEHINSDKAKKKLYVEKAKNTVSNWSREKTEIINAKKKRNGKDNGMFGKNRSGKNNPRYGAKLSDETKKKISLSNTGKTRTEDQRKHSSLVSRKYWTDENKEKRSKKWKMLGIKPPSPKGMLWWNNGEISKRSKTNPGLGWVRGRV